MSDKILEIKNLVIHYETDSGVIEAVNNISFHLNKGESLGLVGETGAGKTTTALGIMGLVPEPTGHLIQGEIILNGKNLVKESTIEMRKIRGRKMSMIFQDPMTSLNPVITVGEQIAEVIRLHDKISVDEAAIKAQEMLMKVGIPPDRYGEYPHQFSGGMRQRVVIAIALACDPELLIADEPTTALDVTIQAQVIDLIREINKEFNTAMLLITHDLGVVADICDRVAIIYAGEIVEMGSLKDIFDNAMHPYTLGLFGSIPSLDKDVERLVPIKGLMPDPSRLPGGCSFYSRCDKAMDICRNNDPKPIEVSAGHIVKCHLMKGEGKKL